MSARDSLLLVLAATLLFGLLHVVRASLRNRLRHSTWHTLRRFRVRLERYKLVERDRIREELLSDPVILEAMREHGKEYHLADTEVRRRVNEYVEEIVPFFNVLSYYRVGYNLSRLVINLLYKASIDYRDHQALDRIPRTDAVVYVMNHRSNADYVVVAYVLARVVSISYAVGEWARTWPLEYVFKSFGSYFVRRRYREPLYHAVLQRYVQLITRNGVTQGIFPEGGLTRDGALRPPKLGLLDYMIRVLDDPAFSKDIWLVPVGINYDRVLEDRSLIKEGIVGGRRLSRWAQFGSVAGYMLRNLGRLLTGRLQRYGRVAVNFGTPISVRAWLAQQPEKVLGLPKVERLPHVQRLAELALERIGAVIPVTPVPLASAALLSFGTSVVSRRLLLERLDEIRDRLDAFNAKVVRRELPVTEVWDRAWRMFQLRRLVLMEGDYFIVLPAQRPLLEYYANSIGHLLPASVRVVFSPAAEADATLPRLARRDEIDVSRDDLPVPKPRAAS